MPFSIDGKQPPRVIKVCMVTNSCENVQHLALIRRRISNAVRSYYGKPQRIGYTYRHLIPPFFLPLLVTLDFDINVVTPEDRNQPLDNLYSSFFPTACNRCCKWTLIASSQANQPIRKFL